MVRYRRNAIKGERCIHMHPFQCPYYREELMEMIILFRATIEIWLNVSPHRGRYIIARVVRLS